MLVKRADVFMHRASSRNVVSEPGGYRREDRRNGRRLIAVIQGRGKEAHECEVHRVAAALEDADT
jgi:hypothetical protein